METNWGKVIERYLQGELSAEGIEAFEFELSMNADLRSELDLHKMIHESVFRSADRLAIQSIGAKYHFRLKLKKWLAFTSIVTTVAVTAALIAMNSGTEKPASPAEKTKPLTETPAADQPELTEGTDLLADNTASANPSDRLALRTPYASSERAAQTTAGETFGDNNLNETVATSGTLPVNASTPAIKEKPAAKLPEPKVENTKKVVDTKQRLILSKGLMNPMNVTTQELDSGVPSGPHWTLGNFMIYATEEGLTFHNYITDDVIVVGRAPKDQLKPPVQAPKGIRTEPKVKKDKGKIYLQNY